MTVRSRSFPHRCGLKPGFLSMDIVVLAITVISFALLFAYVRACELL
jgi:hypothetical protein